MTEDKATTACHIEALYSFYEEETGISAFLSGDASTSLNKGGQTPTAATATKKPPPPSRPPPPADTETLPEAPAAARGSIVAARATSDREMRTRKATSESSGPHNGLSATAASSFPIRNSKPNDLWSSEKKKNLSRPIVVMIHGVERVDTGALRDLCQLLTQVTHSRHHPADFSLT